MKKRIIALVLALVMVVLALASCGEASLVSQDLSQYVEAEFDVNAFFEALSKLEIEDGDYSANPVIRALVEKQDIYGEISSAIIKEDEKLEDGELDEDDVLYYCYYVTYEKDGKTYVYEYSQMSESTVTDSKTKANHVISLGSVSADDNVEDDFKEALKAAITYGDISEYIYSTNATKNKEVKVSDDDDVITLVVSYTKTWTEEEQVAGGDPVKTDYTAQALYEVITLSKAAAETDPLIKVLIGADERFSKVSVKVGNDVSVTTSKPVTDANGEPVLDDKGQQKVDETTATKFTVTEDDGIEYTYSEFGVEWIVESAGKEIATFTDKTYTAETKLEDNQYHVHTSGEEKPELKDVELTYHVYPVYYYDVPEVNATTIIKHVLGSAIKAGSFKVFEDEAYKAGEGESAKTVKALVAELIDIYAKDSSKTEKFDKDSTSEFIKKLYALKEEVFDKDSADADIVQLYYLSALKNVEKALGDTDASNETAEEKAFAEALVWIEANMAEDEVAEDFFTYKKTYEDNKKIVDEAGAEATSAQKAALTTALTNYKKGALELYADVLSETYDLALEAAVDAKIAEIIAAKNEDGKTAGDALYEEKLESIKHKRDEEYRTYVVEEIGKAIYEIIDKSVKVVAWPEDMVDRYYEHLYESYEYKFYKENYNSSNSFYSWYNADFEAFLVSEHGTDAKKTHNGDWHAAIIDEAKEFISPMIKVYVAAKALQADAVDVVPGFIEADIASGMYEADYEYDDSISEKKNQKAEKKAKEEAEEYKASLRENAAKFLITDEVFKDWKREYGSAYDYYEDSYGEDNIRMGLQFNNLFYYLVGTAMEKVEHDGEDEFLAAYDSALKDNDGNYSEYKIKFHNTKISYTFKADEAEGTEGETGGESGN